MDRFKLPHHRAGRMAISLGIVLGIVSTGLAGTAWANEQGNLDQCANGPASAPVSCQASGDWVNGNLGANKAHYVEGDSASYRLRFSGLTPGATTHVATIQWDTTQNGKHSLDYITSFNRTVNADPCAGVSGCGAATTFPIPTDPHTINQIAGVFTMYGGAISAVSAYTLTGSYAGSGSTSIQVTFTASTANPVLAWGGHIGTQADWGTGNSAVSIPGSPYHMRFLDLDGSGGNQDRSLTSSAIQLSPAKLTVTKVVNNAHGGTKVVADFPLFVGSTQVTSGVQGSFSTGTYVVSETQLPGYTGTISGDCAANGSITLALGEVKSCTITNNDVAPLLTVTKVVNNTHGGTKVVADFPLFVGSTQVTSGVHGSFNAGTYTVHETQLSGYTGTISGDCAANGSITLAVGDVKSCTITNNDVAPTQPSDPGTPLVTPTSPATVTQPSGSIVSAPAPAIAVQVLHETITRSDPAAAEGTSVVRAAAPQASTPTELPRTGASTVPMGTIALALIMIGTLLCKAGRRRLEE